MTAPKRILCSIGTRPEAIKMAPIVLGLRREPWAEVRVLATAQHRKLLDEALAEFSISADADLDLMRPNQSLSELTARLAVALDALLERERPDLVLAQGDTTSVFMTALACFYRKVPFGHVEAGLRTGDRYYPFPEEMNRALTAQLATLHFAPTARARDNLAREGIAKLAMQVTGNTVIDALLDARERLASGQASPALPPLDPSRRLILMTAHRRENFGAPIREVFHGVRDIADDFEDVEVLYPVHPNPNVVSAAREILAGHPRIHLIEPVGYLAFVALMDRSTIILTDSGGVQEEAPALGKPVLVFRDETERPEAVDAGVVRLVGPDRARIRSEAKRLLSDPNHYRAMAKGVSPYGDGRAARRIVGMIKEFFAGGAGGGY